jgi:hypothetical protein
MFPHYLRPSPYKHLGALRCDFANRQEKTDKLKHLGASIMQPNADGLSVRQQRVSKLVQNTYKTMHKFNRIQ